MDRAVAEPFVTRHLYVFYCMFARLHAGDNITDSLVMTDSYSTEDAGRSGVVLSPLQYDSTIISYLPAMSAARCSQSTEKVHVGGGQEAVPRVDSSPNCPQIYPCTQ